MSIKGCIAMVLAGGRGERLGALTRYYPKSTVHFGGNHRIIDFTLNNCKSSRIDTVGILSQHLSFALQDYILGAYDCLPEHSDIYMLPPQNGQYPYCGTADAVYKNIEFIERFEPKNVLVLPGDHIYNMDYNKMIAFHEETGADVTVASTPVPINEASRFGIINAAKGWRVCGFEEKPLRPKSCLASMGVYIFKLNVLKRYLFADSAAVLSRHDFAKDILPKMLNNGELICTYQFDGYWRDVGTVSGLWEANMDMIDDPSVCRLQNYRLSYTSNIPSFISPAANVSQSVISSGCSIFGQVEHSVLNDSVKIGKGAEIVNSVVMPGAYIGNNAKIHNAVIGTNATVMDDTVIGTDSGTDFFADQNVCGDRTSLVAPWLCVKEGMAFKGGSHIYEKRLLEWESGGTNMLKTPDSRQMPAGHAFSKVSLPLERVREMA